MVNALYKGSSLSDSEFTILYKTNMEESLFRFPYPFVAMFTSHDFSAVSIVSFVERNKKESKRIVSDEADIHTMPRSIPTDIK